MDNEIEIFTLDDSVKIKTTIGELKDLYAKGYGDGGWPSLDEEPTTIKGEIIERT